MAQYTCKLLTDRGIRYVTYDNTIDQFISYAYTSTEDVARARCDGTMAEECEEEAERHIYDMRRLIIHRATKLISDLKLGQTLQPDDMVLLSGVHKFLEATVAPQQYVYPEISDEVIDSWIFELGLRQQFPDHNNEEILGDRALYPAIQEVRQRRDMPEFFDKPYKPPTEAQNKLTGRYLSQLAIIANIVGPNQNTPEEVVDKFYSKMKG